MFFDHIIFCPRHRVLFSNKKLTNMTFYTAFFFFVIISILQL